MYHRIRNENNIMRILWVCNVPTPEAQVLMGKIATNNVSWIVNLSDHLRNHVELTICFPQHGLKKNAFYQGDKIAYYAFPGSNKAGTEYSTQTEIFLSEIISKVNPNIIHVWGTEFPHTYSCINAAEKCGVLDRVVISIQGLVSIYSIHYVEGVPYKVTKRHTIRDFIRHMSLSDAQKKFVKRGWYEIESIRRVKHVIGRTDWDYACTKMFNPNIMYHFNNETLRSEFYNERWDYKQCRAHSIFMSQGGYPIKGMHYMLDALAMLKERYQDVKLYVTGRNLLNMDSWRDLIKQDYFSLYLKRKIKKLHLENSIVFLGSLNATQMVEQYKLANVYVSASIIENSPNSLGEAMLIGTPVVASDVGGVRNLLKDKKEGYIYPNDEPYMLAHYVGEIFEQKENVQAMCDCASRHARVTHDLTSNLSTLLEVYNSIDASK